MPLGFAKSSFTYAAAGGAGNSGFYQSEFFDSDSQKAAHPMVDIGSGNNWHGISDFGKFSIMFWMKGTTSSLDSSYNNQVILRTLASDGGDNGNFAEVTASGFVLGSQKNNSSFKLIIWQPGSFSSNYLDDEWHHFVFELNGTSSKVYADGVNKSSEATLPGDNNDNNPAGTTRYAFINGSTSSANNASYSGFRTGKLQFADTWMKFGSGNALVSNIGSIYSSGWVDLGDDGTISGTLTDPDIFLSVDSDALASDLRSGASTSVLKGTSNANLITSSTGGAS